jgi:hypothetical protein
MVNTRMSINHIVPIAFTATFLVAGHAVAQAPNKTADSPKWGPHLDFELKPGSRRSVGESDLFLPLAQDDQTLFFADLRGRLDNQGDREGNLGVGVRRMLDGGWNVGGYGYFDRRRTENSNHFNQITLGAEALGPDWDFRGNVYVPQGNRVRQVGGITTVGGVTTASLSGTSVQMITSAATTTTREERALPGFDIEAGWRVPVFESEDRQQLRLYVGGYRFSDGIAKVSGSRARLEFQLADLSNLWPGGRLTVGAEWQHDRPRGGQAFVGVRLRIPLGGGDKGSEQTLNAQQRRMTAPVVRDIDIVTQGRTNIIATTPAIVETASALSNGRALTVLDSATTTGAALPGAVAAAGANSTVLLSGAFNTTVSTTLQTGQTLMGAGTLTVRAPSGRTATLTTPMATINGAVAASNPVVFLANNSTLTGLNVNSINPVGSVATNIAVRANGVTGATVANNVLVATGTGLGNGAQALLINGSSNVTVLNNTLTASSVSGPAPAVGLNVVASTGVLVSGNTMSASSVVTGADHAIRVNGGSFVAGSTGNTIAAGHCEVALAGTGSIGLTNGATCP